jgi:hypothetical protein
MRDFFENQSEIVGRFISLRYNWQGLEKRNIAIIVQLLIGQK